MMIGEFEYVSIFFEDTVHYQVLGYIMFCVSLLIMSIIIMNLLVSDIKVDVKIIGKWHENYWGC